MSILTTTTTTTTNTGGRLAGRVAVAVVVAVAAVWGVSFAVVKETIEEVTPAWLVGLRFLIATGCLLALRPGALRGLDRRTVLRGAVLGALLGSGFLLCTIGMQTTSVLVSAFVVGSTVAFVPLVGWVWLRRRLAPPTAAAVTLAVVGLALVTLRGFSVSPGTALIAAAALVWAVHLVALERWSHRGELYRLTVVQLATAAVLAFLLRPVLEPGGVPPVLSVAALLGLLGLGAVATAGAFVALSWAQTRIDATTAAVLLTLEPLTGAALGVLQGDGLTVAVLAGAVAILTAAGLAQAGLSGRARCPRR
jgi:drug/metabolite transporter (DMT)-like permease